MLQKWNIFFSQNQTPKPLSALRYSHTNTRLATPRLTASCSCTCICVHVLNRFHAHLPPVVSTETEDGIIPRQYLMLGAPRLWKRMLCQGRLATCWLTWMSSNLSGKFGNPSLSATYTGQHKHRSKADIYISIPQVGFEPTLPVFQQTNAFCAFDRAATTISKIYGLILIVMYKRTSSVIFTIRTSRGINRANAL
jgi:hypothetical protein